MQCSIRPFSETMSRVPGCSDEWNEGRSDQGSGQAFFSVLIGEVNRVIIDIFVCSLFDF